MTLDPQIRETLDGTPVAHLASLLPDGSPHSVPLWIGTYEDFVVFFTGPGSRKARNLRRDPRVALSAIGTDPFRQVLVRGRVVEWRDGDAGWEIVDRVAAKYTGGTYSREQERIAALIEPDWQKVGIG